MDEKKRRKFYEIAVEAEKLLRANVVQAHAKESNPDVFGIYFDGNLVVLDITSETELETNDRRTKRVRSLN